jgi:hypothetical protein
MNHGAPSLAAAELTTGLKLGRIAEFLVLFGLVPLLLALRVVRPPLLSVLWLACLYCTVHLRLAGKSNLLTLQRDQVHRREWWRMLGTFALLVPVIAAVVLLVRPSALLTLPLHHTGRWLLLMAVYPLLSVLPQEIVYRAFFFERYRFLFGGGRWLLVGSAIAFSLTHLAFRNWEAVALTLAGGLLFAHSYGRSRALLLVVCEHTLYGCAVFTLGLGSYLAEGTLRWLH